MKYNKPKILIISKNRMLQYRVYINLIAFDAEIKLIKNISQINKTIYLEDYDLVVINISNKDDIQNLKELGIKNHNTKYLFINTMNLFKKHNYKNFLTTDFTDTDILLKSSDLLYH